MSINTQFGDLISPTFTPSGRGGLREFLLGTPEQFVRTPSREMLYEQMIRGLTQNLPRGYDLLSTLLGPQSGLYSEFEEPAIRMFQEQLVPELAGRFTARGEGGQGSSAYQQQMNAAASRLAQDLAARRTGMRQSALDQLFSQAGQAMAARPFDLIPRRPGALEGGALGLLQGLGQGVKNADKESIKKMLGME